MKFKINVHQPRIIEQKYTTMTVNFKEIEDPEVARDIKRRLDDIMPGIIKDAGGQLTVEGKPKKHKDDLTLDEAGGTPEGKANAKLVKEKVTKKAK